MHVDQQEGNTLLFLAFARGAHQAETLVRPLTVGIPCLLAVDDVVVTLAFGAGLERSQVGTRSRLGITLAPPVLAGKNARQVMLLLPFAAETDDHRPDHMQSERREPRRTCGRALLLENVALDRRPSGAAVLDWPAGGNPALFEQDLLPAHVVVLAEPAVFKDLARHIAGEMGTDELMHLVAKRDFFLPVVQIHREFPGGLQTPGRTL